MARLIDADAFEKFIKDKYEDGESTDDIKDQMLFDLSYQSTAYDVEKVVAEFEHEADLQDYLRENASARCNVAQAHIHRYAEQCYRNKAIEIVRKGGA